MLALLVEADGTQKRYILPTDDYITLNGARVQGSAMKKCNTRIQNAEPTAHEAA